MNNLLGCYSTSSNLLNYSIPVNLIYVKTSNEDCLLLVFRRVIILILRSSCIYL